MAGWHGTRPPPRGYGAAPQRGNRLASVALVAALHILAILAILAAFTPDIGRRAVQSGLVALDLRDPPPPPPATAPPARTAAPAGKQAIAAPLAAPTPKIVVAPVVTAPPVAATGTAAGSGARESGAGTGAGGAGQGTGGGGQRFVQIAGRIDSARDYPIETRDQRIGTAVVIVFTVGTDGRVHNCRVRDPSGDPRSDAITCRLAEDRFRFRPSTDAAGNPIEATYGWRQSWHY